MTLICFKMLYIINVDIFIIIDHLVIWCIGITAVTYEVMCSRSLRKSFNKTMLLQMFQISKLHTLSHYCPRFMGIRYKRGFRLLIASLVGAIHFVFNF